MIFLLNKKYFIKNKIIFIEFKFFQKRLAITQGLSLTKNYVHNFVFEKNYFIIQFS